MPSVWIETRINKHGKNNIVRWEMSGKGIKIRGAESCGPSKQYAQQRADEIRRDLYAGRPIKQKVDVSPIGKFADEYLSNSEKTKAPNTFKNFDTPAVRHFSAWYGNKPLGFVDAKIITAWRDALIGDGLAPNTVRMRLRALSAAFGWAVVQGMIERNPFEAGRKSHLFPKAVSPARYLTPDEVKGIIQHLPRRQAEAFYFLLHTGLRHNELISFDWKAIKRPPIGPWEAEVCSKNGKPGVILIEDQVKDVLGHPQSAGRVFPCRTRTWLNKAIRAAVKASGIGGTVRPHDARHTWATNFMARTGNTFELLYRGRWSSLASAAVYQHIRKSDHPTKYPPFSHYFPTKRKTAVSGKSPKTAIFRRSKMVAGDGLEPSTPRL